MSIIKPPNNFELRGDLGILKSGRRSDCDVIAGKQTFHVHSAILASRGGQLAKLLNADAEVSHEPSQDQASRIDTLTSGAQGPAENIGKQVIEIESHSAKSVDLVLEFIYGASKISVVEYPAPEHPMIQSCILLYNLGHDFKISDLSDYAISHLGSYLSRELKKICIYPLSKAKTAAAGNKFIEDLRDGVVNANKANQAHEDRDLPFKMLTDFIVVGRDVLFREPLFRDAISEGVLPRSFLQEVLLAQFGTAYQTVWMRNLMMQTKPRTQALKTRKCTGCGDRIAADEQVVFNPWSGLKFSQRYAQVCCEECARVMDKGHGKGVSWAVFGNTE